MTLAPAEWDRYTRPGLSIDSDHPAVVAFAREHGGPAADDRERAIRLYYAVRDRFRYDPYSLDQSEHGFRASTGIERAAGYCIPKAALLAAACRAGGIPARVGYADVRNHLTSPRLRDLCQGSPEFPRCDHGNSPPGARPVSAGRSALMASRWRRMR